VEIIDGWKLYIAAGYPDHHSTYCNIHLPSISDIYSIGLPSLRIMIDFLMMAF
jgi:hypothetical protein